MRACLVVVIAGIVGVVACKSSSDDRGKACEAARDRALPWMEKATADAIGAASPDMRAELEAEARKEIEAFKTRFVDVCKQTTTIDLSCLDSMEKNGSKPCRDSLQPVWKQVYGK